MNEQLKNQIEQEATFRSGYNEDRDCTPISKGHYYGYIAGAEAYATRAITAEQEVERLRKALEEILNTNHDNYERVIIKVKSIATEALTPKPTTNE